MMVAEIVKNEDNDKLLYENAAIFERKG